MPVAPELWVAGAAVIETALGLAIILGVLTRFSAVVGFAVLTLAMFALPDDPMIAHVGLFGLSSMLVITGAGRWSLDRVVLAPVGTASPALVEFVLPAEHAWPARECARGGGPMSGHSKWSTIKRQKGANDAKRGALFTKLAREIITAARQGGGDTDANYRLRMAVEKARANSMPAENIRRAIERATGAGADAEQYEEVTYEGLGPANVAVMIAAMTDNRNRTASDIRSAFNKAGGSLSTVAWQFEQKGMINVPLNGQDPDEVTLAAIDAGATDVGTPDGGSILVTTEPTDLESVRSALAGAGFEADSAELSMEPTTSVEIGDEKTARAVLQFMERLEDLDDVQNVYANFDIPAELMERLEAQVV